MISVLTYNHPHRKTQDVLFRLKALGYDAKVIAVPWQERKNFMPLFRHRPDSCIDIPLGKLCKRLDYELIHIDSDYQVILDELQPRVSLIAGAGIIRVRGHKIINAHPGYIPRVRGLDAVKWAIYKGEPVGVTTYYITDEVDMGEIIDRQIIGIEPLDDFYTFSMRVYEKEIEMLVEAIDKDPCIKDDDYVGIPTRRMPHRLEVVMMEKFRRLCTI